MRKISLGMVLVASASLLAAGCKSTSSTTPTNPSTSAINGTGTRSGLIAGNDPTSLNTKSPPPGPDLFVSTARVYEGSQDFEGAKTEYDRALKIDPAYLPALLGYAHLLDTQKDFDGADKYYERAAKKHPEVAAVYNDWGMSQQRRGHLNESAKLLSKAVHLQPNKQLYRNNLAMVDVVMHRPEEAYRELAAIETPAVAHFNVAAILHRAGDDQSAAYHFAQASKEDPNWEQARVWSERLGGTATPPASNAAAIASDIHAPPPDPQPDPAAAPYLMASRAPIVEQAYAPPAPSLNPLPSPMPPVQEPASEATVVSPVPTDKLPPFGGVEPGPVTQTSGIAYPGQLPSASSPPSSRVAEPQSSEGMPPLPPSGLGLAPFPPVR